jgi:antitoxin component YwqK of YwqJK toxin-antitoxin module
MMGKNISRNRSRLFKSISAFILMFLGFVYCTQEELEPYVDWDKNIRAISTDSGRIHIDSSSKPYTGTANMFRKGSGILISENIFLNGREIASTYYSSDGKLRADYHVITYSGKKKISYSIYYENGNKREEFWDPEHTYPELGYVKKWYEDGTLKSEYSWGLGYSLNGYVTSYDKQGAVIEQELYDNGKFIEKIK